MTVATVERGYCLNSDEIWQRVRDGKIIIPKTARRGVKDRIQPSSLDTSIGDECYLLDRAQNSLFKPREGETVYRVLSELPGRERKKVNISGGFELKVGFSYLFKLEESVLLSDNEAVENSPKSSFGRLFIHDRMIADFSQGYDWARMGPPGVPLDLWLLIQPRRINVIVHPGLTLNQIRHFDGPDANLTAREIHDVMSREPLLCYKDDNGDLQRAPHKIINGGLEMHLDLSGRDTSGVVALLARHYPEPVDLERRRYYRAEDYFEPLFPKNGKVHVRTGDCVLISSKEITRMPGNLNSKLRMYSQSGLEGSVDDAGFIDPGFKGVVVCEVTSNEAADIWLEDGMSISELDVFRMRGQAKVYGEDIGSHYQGQLGPRVAKFFKEMNYAWAAKEYKKLDRIVICQEARLIKPFTNSREGLRRLSEARKKQLFDLVQDGFPQIRYHCDDNDQMVLQPIPYIFLFAPGRRVYAYVRADTIQESGEEKLFGKASLGIGGHINIEDDPNDRIGAGRRREFREELSYRVEKGGKVYSRPVPLQDGLHFIGTLTSRRKEVDLVHVGLVYAGMLKEGVDSRRVYSRDTAVKHGCFVRISDLVDEDPRHRYRTTTFCGRLDKPAEVESWTALMMKNLNSMYDQIRAFN